MQLETERVGREEARAEVVRGEEGRRRAEEGREEAERRLSEAQVQSFSYTPKERLLSSDGRDQNFKVETKTETYFGSHGIETETKTFILGLVGSRLRPRLSFLVSLNQDRDRDFHFASHGIETET